MIDRAQLFTSIPEGLRTPLLEEFDALNQSYLEAKWSPAELSGGKFCEIVYTIIDGYSTGSFASSPSKPRNFVDACKRLEQNSNLPRSFQILIPRILPSLYEVRNNRGVGHVGGDVNPNFMDASFVLNATKWIMCELARVLHSLSVKDAQTSIDQMSSITIPQVWDNGPVRRVLDYKASLKDQILLLLTAGTTNTTYAELIASIEPKTEGYLKRTIRNLHKKRILEYDETNETLTILPPGALYISQKLSKLQ
jgi:hypothetical protein